MLITVVLTMERKAGSETALPFFIIHPAGRNDLMVKDLLSGLSNPFTAMVAEGGVGQILLAAMGTVSGLRF